MSKDTSVQDKAADPMAEDKPKELKGYPRKGETDLENLPSEWLEEDRQISGRKPDLGEQEDDDAEL